MSSLSFYDQVLGDEFGERAVSIFRCACQVHIECIRYLPCQIRFGKTAITVFPNCPRCLIQLVNHSVCLVKDHQLPIGVLVRRSFRRV